MAKNLRAKIPPSDLLTVYDVNTSATKQFAEELGIVASNTDAPGKGTGIHLANDPREVAEKSVSTPISFSPFRSTYDHFCDDNYNFLNQSMI